jgi:putative ABC transport system permease protein
MSATLPRLVSLVFRALVPIAEREEVLADLQWEFGWRATTYGVRAARWWAWRQAIGSLPALVRRGWWRGMTGFEPDANRMRPGGPMFESWIMDVRYAGRRLLSRPAYALLAILTLALGAGGTAAIFSIARTMLFDPLPIAREQQVGVFWFSGSWSEREFLLFQRSFPGFERVAAYRPNDLTLEVPGSPMQLLTGVATTAEFFDVLGARPFLGRTFQAGEDAVGRVPVVLSHSLWRDLGSDPAIVGRRIQIGGIPRDIVGVMPPGFWFPSPATRIWTTAQLNPQNGSGRYTLVGRVAQGNGVENMQGQMTSIASTVGAAFPTPGQWDKTTAPKLTAAREFLVGDLRPAIKATLAAMAVILLIACGNVAALMLGQVDARSTEMAVRAALGANRQRLVQQLVIESLLIGVAAGIGGGLLSAAGFRVLVTALPLGALAETARLDWTVFWASMAAAAGAAMLIAIVPGLALWRRSSLRATMATTRTGGVAARGGRLEGGLVVAQMALAVLLAASAGLLIRSVMNLRSIDPGIDTRGLAVVDATMPLRLTLPQRKQVIDRMVSELRALPGVQSAAETQKLPLRASGDNWGVSIPGRTDLAGVTTAFRIVTRDYLATMGMPLRRGRTFDASDREGSDPVVVINEAMAAKLFPNDDPIGKVLVTFRDRNDRIIGIVGNAAEAKLTDPPVPARYMLNEHVPYASPQVSFVLRAATDDGVPALLSAARSAIGREGTQLAVQQTTTMRAIVELAFGPAGHIVTLLTILAGLALVLGAVGIYGVMSHYVGRRARDYGICIALGEQPRRVIRQVVGRGALLVATGSAIGIAAALLVTKVLKTLLYGVQPTDPLALAAAVAVLLATGMLAAFVPARRASLTDPAMVLRE